MSICSFLMFQLSRVPLALLSATCRVRRVAWYCTRCEESLVPLRTVITKWGVQLLTLVWSSSNALHSLKSFDSHFAAIRTHLTSEVRATTLLSTAIYSAVSVILSSIMLCNFSVSAKEGMQLNVLFAISALFIRLLQNYTSLALVARDEVPWKTMRFSTLIINDKANHAILDAYDKTVCGVWRVGKLGIVDHTATATSSVAKAMRRHCDGVNLNVCARQFPRLARVSNTAATSLANSDLACSTQE